MRSGESGKGFFNLVTHVVSIVFQFMPKTFLLFLFVSVASGIATAANTVFKQRFFDLVEACTLGGAVSAAIKSGIIMGLFLVFTLFLRVMSNIITENFFKKVEGYMGRLLNDKAAAIDPIIYEDNRFLDNINKASKGVEGATMAVGLLLNILLSQASYFIFMGAYFLTIKPMLLLMLLISFLPSIAGSFVRYRLYSQVENQAAPYRRRCDYYGKCIYDREYAKETRLLGGFHYFYGLFQECLGMVTKLNWKVVKKSELMEIALRFLTLIGYVGILVMLFYYLMRGEIGVAIFAAVFSSIYQMFEEMDFVFNHEVGEIMQNLGLAQNYLSFLALPEHRSGSEDPIPGKSIVLKDVSFSYPNANGNAIDHVSIKIAEGETIAIVGENGAGKSTLVRLLTGLYLPDSGEVIMDGIDIKSVAPLAVYQNLSGVFQKFQRYKMTLEENVTIAKGLEAEGDVPGALKKASLDINDRSFPDGIHTMLGKDFGGVDISGGQWQRLAIARGFYRSHNLIILDEPTAAIDPIEETRIYQKFAEISKGKTAVIVTHRLGSARIADRIVVMEQGKIVDVGSHDKLMEKPGKYREMYNAQRKWYQ